MPKTKKCGRCGETKSTTEFYKDRARYDGLDNRCKPCLLAQAKESRARPKGTKKYKRAVYAGNIKRKYGVTIEQYDLMFKCQDGVCAICHKPEPRHYNGVRMRLAVDHNHDTGEARQLLCSKCNFVIGLAQEDPDILEKAVSYLNKHNTQNQGDLL